MADQSPASEQQPQAVPMLPMDHPLVVAIGHAFEVYDLDDIEDQDGDMLRGLSRLAAATHAPDCEYLRGYRDAARDLMVAVEKAAYWAREA